MTICRDALTIAAAPSMFDHKRIHLTHATASTPGAIANLQLTGGDHPPLLRALTGVGDWPIGRVRLADFAGIDEGLAVRLAEDVTQLMPHGGTRVVQRLTARLLELGAKLHDPQSIDPLALFPEAQDRIEAITLAALARAASPMAIDALLPQPARWRALHARHEAPTSSDLAASHILNRLITPPIVVLAGKPNVGKSTLSNALLGRMMSIASPVAGTTRDYVAGRLDLAGLVVDWHDTPGLRGSAEADVVESRAIEIATRLIERADLIVAMRDSEHDWPSLPRPPHSPLTPHPPHLFVWNKVDDTADGQSPDAGLDANDPLRISALTGRGLATLTRAVRDRLVPPVALAHKGVWVYDERLLA